MSHGSASSQEAWKCSGARDGGIHKWTDTGKVQKRGQNDGGGGWMACEGSSCQQEFGSIAWLCSALMFVQSTEDMLLLG